MVRLKIEGIVKWRGLKLQGPLYIENTSVASLVGGLNIEGSLYPVILNWTAGSGFPMY